MNGSRSSGTRALSERRRLRLGRSLLAPSERPGITALALPSVAKHKSALPRANRLGCGSNGVRSECPDSLMIRESGRRHGPIFGRVRAHWRPLEKATARSDAAGPPECPQFLSMKRRPAGHPDRAHVAAYARWKIGSDYARKLRTGRARPSSHRGYYANLRVASSFTRWLHDNDLTLEQTRQAHVDDWLNGSPSRALPTRAFLTWANTTGIVPALHVPRPAPRTTNTPIDHATRLTQARGLLDNSDAEPAIRIAGTLLLLYGQLITRVHRQNPRQQRLPGGPGPGDQEDFVPGGALHLLLLHEGSVGHAPLPVGTSRNR